MLIKGMTEQEIRVLQEFRRVATDTLALATITAIKHPAGGGEAPAFSLAAKGFLAADTSGENFVLTSKAKEFLSYDPKPEFEGESGAEEVATEIAE